MTAFCFYWSICWFAGALLARHFRKDKYCRIAEVVTYTATGLLLVAVGICSYYGVLK